jgi:hypothetical protein
MSGMKSNLVLRLDRRLRTLIVVSVGVWAVIILIFAVMAALQAIPLATVPLAMLLVVIATGWRWSSVEVVGDDAQLLVRNVMTTRVIPRVSIRDFRPGGSVHEFPGRAIRAVLVDGSTVVLTATGRFSPRDASDDARLAELLEWVHRRSSVPS